MRNFRNLCTAENNFAWENANLYVPTLPSTAKIQVLSVEVSVHDVSLESNFDSLILRPCPLRSRHRRPNALEPSSL
jgi:hypothetical protein